MMRTFSLAIGTGRVSAARGTPVALNQRLPDAMNAAAGASCCLSIIVEPCWLRTASAINFPHRFIVDTKQVACRQNTNETGAVSGEL